MLETPPDMASRAVGSNRFPTRIYENSPDLVDRLAAEMRVKPEIEALDLSRIFQAVRTTSASTETGSRPPTRLWFAEPLSSAQSVTARSRPPASRGHRRRCPLKDRASRMTRRERADA